MAMNTMVSDTIELVMPGASAPEIASPAARKGTHRHVDRAHDIGDEPAR